MTETMTAIADRVRGIAAEKRYTQRRIAAVLGLSRSSVTERLNGRVSFSAAELYVLANEMGVPVTRFFPEVARAA